MARIVCQVLHRPNRVTFLWSEGAASFEPYHLQGPETEAFYQAARSARHHLARIVQGADAQAAVDLAHAGHQLYKAIFRHNANDPQAREIENWLSDLRNRNGVVSLDMLGDVPGRIPWNAVYDQEPADQAVRSGDPGALRPFWGFQYVLAAGKRANPLRVACVLDSPNILLVVDPDLVDTLPAAEKNRLGDWAISHELTILDSVTGLRKKLLDEAPDILYIFAAMEHGALRLGQESITAQQVRELLAEAKEGNPDPIVFLQASGDAANWETWECFLGSTVNTLSGVVMCEVPPSPALANALGVDALARFLQNQGVGQALKDVRCSHDLAALAYSAFCPAHVKIAGDNNTEPDVPGPEPLPLPESPYRPLAPFESEDRALFTGREDDTVRCASLLDEAATHGLVLHGAGGVGKSSFLRAGLLPHLETEAVGYLALRDRTPDDQVQGESAYPVVAVRPGSDLTGQLAEALCVFCAQPYAYTTPAGNRINVDLPGMLRAVLQPALASGITAGPPPQPSEVQTIAESSTTLPDTAPSANTERPPAEDSAAALWRALDRNPNLLAGVLDELTRRLPFELVLVVEQAEDLVLQVSKDEASRRRRALESLAGVIRSSARCKIILAVRTEYFGRLSDHFPTGPERWRNYFLDELGEEQMLRAILLPTAAEPIPYGTEIPRQKYHFTFEHDLAARLVKEVVKAARDKQRSPLPLLQALGADLYERMLNRKDDVITKAHRKDQGPAEQAVVRYVNKKILDLPLAAGDRQELRNLMDQLYYRHTDGTITRELVPTTEIAESWKSSTPLESVLDAAAQEGLVEVNQLLVQGRPELFLSLPQESLAQTAAQWDEDRKRNAFGRTRIIDTLWIMIPLMFLVAAVTWTVTRHLRAPASAEENPSTNEELAKKFLRAQSALEQSRWPAYVGDLVRAEQAWNNDNPLRARQILLEQQPLPQQTDLREFEWHYLWNKMRGQGPEAAGHKGLITRVAISPDGTIGASASQDGTVKLWNLAKAEEYATLQGHAGPVLAVAFSPDGKTIASGGADKVIRLWNAAAKDKPAIVEKEQQALTGHGGAVAALVVGKEGLVSAGADKQVILWDVTTGKETKVFKDHTGAIVALAVAPDGKTIASADADQVILVHDGTKTLQTIKSAGPISALAFAPDGKTLASGGTEKEGQRERGLIHFWDPATGKKTATPLQHASQVLALAYVPQTKLLASAGKDNLLRLWDLATGRQVPGYRGHLGWVSSFAVSGSGSTLVSGSHDGSIKIWNSLPPDVIAAHEDAAQAVVFLAEDKAVVSGGRDGTVKFWDPATGQLLAKLTGLGSVTSLALSTKTTPARLAAGTWTDKNEGEVRLWDVTWDAKEGLQTKELPSLKGHTKGVTCLAFAAGGKILASGSADQTAILWDMDSGKQKYVLKGHEGEVRCLAFTSSGRAIILITGGAEGKVRQWDGADGKEFRPPLQAHAGPVNAVAYFFGVVGFVTAGEDYSTKFWIWNPKEEPVPSKIHRSNTQAITALALSPNRRFLVVGSLDQTVKLFDSQLHTDEETQQTGPTRFFAHERFTFTGLDSSVRAVAVSANSSIVAGACENGTIRFWRAPALKVPTPE